MSKPKIEKPAKLASFIKSGVLADEQRDSIVDTIRLHIFTDVETKKDLRLSIDPVVVNGLWVFLRVQIVSAVMNNLPEHFLTPADDINLCNLMETVQENLECFESLLLPTDYLKSEFRKTTEDILYREGVPTNRDRCPMSGLALQKGEPVNEIELHSSKLHVSRTKCWAGGRLSALSLFQLFWEQKNLHQNAYDAVLQNPRYRQGSAREIINEVAQSDEIKDYFVGLIFRFQLITDCLKEVVDK